MLKFAISPAADIHSEDMRIALINYIISRQRAEQFIVHIKETHKEQHSESKDQEILDLLKKFAIEQDQLFYQSDNLGRHQQFALSLVEHNKAFVCVCTTDRCDGACVQSQKSISAQIKSENLPYLIRIKRPEATITFSDRFQGLIHTQPDLLDNFVILGADGIPSDDFASACDDILTNISLVICDEKDLSSTPKHIHIKHSLGYSVDTEYAHIPSIDNLSNKSIKWLLEEGFLLDTIINYLLLVGNETPTEIFTLPEAIEWFTLESLSRHSDTFDIEKLRFLNREHMRSMEEITLSRIFGFADKDIGKLLKLYLEEASTINELEQVIKTIFAPKICTEAYGAQMQTLSACIQEAPILHDFNDFQQYLIDQSGLNHETLQPPLQLLMTGHTHSPELCDIYPLIKPYITEIARCTPC